MDAEARRQGRGAGPLPPGLAIALVVGLGLGLVALLAGCQGQGEGEGEEGASSPSRVNDQSGRLSVFFNDPWGREDALAAQLIKALDAARARLDAAVYRVTAPAVLDALARACDRGVRVRLVLERDPVNADVELPGCVEVRWDDNPRLMHHKFAIVDGRIVWTGSANWTSGSLYHDANDALRIESPRLARAYELEFEEMFARGRFGPEKRDLNDERFAVAGVPVEAYFSPSDRPRARLLRLLREARRSIALALFTLTDDELYRALNEARARGVTVDAVWDFTALDGCLYAEIDELLAEGVGAVDALPGLLHHKFAVVDERVVVTGSANWSKSGMTRNDENLLVIRDEAIARRYLERFAALKGDAERYETSAEVPPRPERRPFAVARAAALLLWRPKALGVVERYEICRLDPRAQARGRAQGRGREGCERVDFAPGWAWYFIDRAVQPGRAYAYRLRAQAPDGAWSPYSDVVRVEVPEGIPTLTAEEAERELRRYEGRVVTVRFTVQNRPRLSRAGHVFLNAGGRDERETDFTAFIPGCALELGRFDGSGLDLFALQGRTIAVTGELQEYNGPEIVVTGPWQIELVDGSEGIE